MIPTDEQIDRWTILAHNERLAVQKGINKTKNTSLRSPKDRPARREWIETIVSLYLMEGGLDEGAKKKPETVKEWLETLPEGYRERAVRNIDAGDENLPADSFSEGVRFAFAWSGSEEGETFWRAVSHWNGDASRLPAIPKSKPSRAK